MQTSNSLSSPVSQRKAEIAQAIGSRRKQGRGTTRLRVDATTPNSQAEAPAQVADVVAGPLGNASVSELGSRLRELNTEADQTRAEFYATIARFDELEGWRASGARNCVRWMIDMLGLGRSRAYEQYRSAKDLHALPTIADAFARGFLNWCKVRSLLRVASAQDEQALTIAAIDLSPDEVQRTPCPVVSGMCDDYRFGKNPGSDAERDKAQHERRSLTWKAQADGSITLHIVLPPESGADVIRCLQHHEELLFSGTSAKNGNPSELPPTAQQRRADSLVAMAHASLGGATDGEVDAAASSAKADRHLVVTHIELDALVMAERQVASEATDSDAPLPIPLRAAIAGILGGSISPATARRLACDGSLVTMIMKGGEPVAVGRRHRLHTTAQRRAILAHPKDAGRKRDGGCTFPGCGATRHLDVHHVTLWRDGGQTSVRDGATLCSACHKRVHDEGWVISRVPDGAKIVRHPDAQAMLDDADERTAAITRRLDTRRAVFRFEQPGAAGSVGFSEASSPTMNDRMTTNSAKAENNVRAHGCSETRGVYRVDPVHEAPREQAAMRLGAMMMGTAGRSCCHRVLRVHPPCF